MQSASATDDELPPVKDDIISDDRLLQLSGKTAENPNHYHRNTKDVEPLSRRATKMSEDTSVCDEQGLDNITRVQPYKLLTLDNYGEKVVWETEHKMAILNSSRFHVLFVLAKVTHTSPLARKLQRCLKSICARTSLELSLHFITDTLGEQAINEVLRPLMELRCGKKINAIFFDFKQIVADIQQYTQQIQDIMKVPEDSYFADPLFSMSFFYHKLLPLEINQVILLDVDLELRSDIHHLFEFFNDFSKEQIMGLAKELQPVYRELFSSYRSTHPNTLVGEPPPDGLTGFNSGVVLMDLHKMCNSKIYNEMVLKNTSIIKEMAEKYQLQGRHGDQDVYSLMSLKYSKLFYVLPCQWNRQLCRYWENKGYQKVFDLYFKCPEPIHIYHGNCRTPIPEA